MKAIPVLILFLSVITIQIHAQKQVNISLRDQSTNQPIQEATYSYGPQFGLSDEDGTIRFEYLGGEDMQFSHIGYGQWVIKEEELLLVMEKGVLTREKISLNIQPVSIIALHSGAGESGSLNLDYTDKMAHDGGGILSQITAISGIRKSGSYGFDPVLRGFKHEQLNIVMNGSQSATVACPNRMDPPTSQMAPNMMDRIEILKGPHALRYGSAFGGTINFIPAGLRFTENPEFYGRFSTGYESNGSILRSEGMLGISGKKYDAGFFASLSDGSDYADGDGRAVRARFRRSSYGTNIGYRINERQQLRGSVLRNVAGDTDFPALPMDLRKDDTWMYNLQHDIVPVANRSLSWTTMVFGSFIDHKMDNLLKNLDPRMLNASTQANTMNYGGRTEGTWRFDQSVLYMGADLRVEGARGIRTREFLMGPNAGNTVRDNAWQNSRISKTSGFSEYRINHQRYKFVFSGRLELNAANAFDPDPDFTSVNGKTEISQLNPSFSMGGIRKLNQRMELGLWLGRAKRSGSLTERYINYFPVGLDPYEMLGNPQIKPEVNNQIDLTFQWANPRTTLDVDLFAASLNDYISSVTDPSLTPHLPSSPGVRRYTNLDRAVLAGFEVNWNQQLLAGFKHQTGLAYTYGKDMNRNEPLPEVAPFEIRYILTGMHFRQKLRSDVTLRYVHQQNRISAEYGETVSPAFALLDLKLSYSLSRIVRLNAGVNNLFDVLYYEHLSRSVRGTNRLPIYAPGRSFFLSLNLDFMK